jgi:succinate dehydrogenase/fumarate reductase cytochrome b subunit
MKFWRWLTARVTLRPRRSTIVLWFLLFEFSNGIDHLLATYSRPLQAIDTWAIGVMVVVGIVLFAWIWYSGRDARAARRSR